MEIKKVYINEENYPKYLKEINNPPKALYYIGDLSILEKPTVAVVGSRKATEYGKWAATEMGRRLGEHGVTVVSGMARGIDTCGHRGALEGGGVTAAVMGCGIDICYPASNRELRKEILKSGLVVSEYPPGTPAAPYTFPRRNRIISGLSLATVIVEAGIQSGSLITAELAAEQGRTVYAVPGNINNVSSFGANKLLKDGAMPLIVPDDLLEDLGIRRKECVETEKNLGDDEKLIYKVIEAGGELTVDQVCKITEKPPSLVTGIITVLEMKGKIYTALGKVFVAKLQK